MPKLTDTQSILLAHAAKDGSGSLYPLPGSHARGGARVTKALAQLLAAGFTEVREGVAPEQTHREDGDLRFGLFVTSAGLAAIGIEPEVAPRPEDDSTPVCTESTTSRQTKTSTVLALLRRPNGATMPELIAATNWLPHTMRAALTGLRKKGHAIVTGKRDGATCYTLGGAAA